MEKILALVVASSSGMLFLEGHIIVAVLALVVSYFAMEGLLFE